MTYFSNYCFSLKSTITTSCLDIWQFSVSVVIIFRSLHFLTLFLHLQKLQACYDIQKASIFTHFLTFNSSVFLNQFNVFGHWAITSLVHAHINPFLSTGFTVVIIHNQQYEILIWSTSSKYQVLKFVVHINNEVKNKTPTVDTEVVDYNRGDLYMVSKKKKPTENTHIKYCVQPPDSSVHDQRSRG